MADQKYERFNEAVLSRILLETKQSAAAAVERATKLLAEREVEVERLRSLLRDAANEWEDEAKDAREVGFIVNAMHCERKATRLRKAVGGDDDVELHGRT